MQVTSNVFGGTHAQPAGFGALSAPNVIQSGPSGGVNVYFASWSMDVSSSSRRLSNEVCLAGGLSGWVDRGGVVVGLVVSSVGFPQLRIRQQRSVSSRIRIVSRRLVIE